MAFYRDGVGWSESGRFVDHAGYDGVFLAIPGSDAELELTSGGDHGAPVPHPESLLVLYFEDPAELDRVASRLTGTEVLPANPYWQLNARAFADPDGFQVLLAVRPPSVPAAD